MKVLTFTFFLVLFKLVLSQDENNNYKSINSYHSIGVNGLSKDSIFAEDVSFVNNISDFVYDTFSNILLSYFALYGGEGKTSLDYVTAYSLGEKKVLWSRLVDRTRAQYNYIKGNLYLITDEHSGLIDIRTDTFKWKVKSRLFLNSELVNKNIVIAPLYKVKNVGKICAALNATTGDTIWTNPNLELKMGIITAPNLIGDSFIFVNEHLHLVDIKNGKYWKSEIKINKILDNSDIFWRELGLSLLTSTLSMGFFSAVGSNYYISFLFYGGESGMYTNAPLVIDNTRKIHVVGINGMCKYDLQGKLMNTISHNNKDNNSSILKIKNQLYYSELGSYIRNNEEKGVFNSSFYIGRLDSNLSTQNRCHLDGDYSLLSKELGHYHVKTEYYNDTFFILFKNGILVLDTNLTILGKFSKTKKEDPEYRDLLLGNFYERNDSIWLKQRYNMGYWYLEKLDKSIDVIDSRFQFVRNIPRNNIYKVYYQDDLITAVVNVDGKSFLLDKNDKTIIDMLRIEKIQKHKNQYFIANLNGYYIINADQLVK